MVGGAFGTVVGNYNQTIIESAAAGLVTLVGVLACIRGSELLKESEYHKEKICLESARLSLNKSA